MKSGRIPCIVFLMILMMLACCGSGFAAEGLWSAGASGRHTAGGVPAQRAGFGIIEQLKDNLSNYQEEDEASDAGNDSLTGSDESGGSSTGSSSAAALKHPGYKPVYELDMTGNFTDIDPKVFETSYMDPKELVGRWYEDGWSNGYCLEFYGDGTWQFLADEVIQGRYEIMYAACDLIDSFYGVSAGQFFLYDSDGPVLSVSIFAGELFPSRTPDTARFRRESDSRPCDDLDAFYAREYPFAELKGEWYPVGDDSGSHYYDLSGEGTWGEVINRAGLEVGRLEKAGKGKYRSEGGNYGGYTTFEYPGDGYLYIDGEPYERRSPDDGPAPDGVVGTWYYYDFDTYSDSDKGYVFNSDWTFYSLPDTPSEEHGTFIFVGDNLLLYDEEGYRLHKFYQNSYMAKSSIHDDDPTDNLENLNYAGPDDWE